MYNMVIQVGRLTRDPELRHTQNSTPVANFSIAVDRPARDGAGNREADFFDVVVWNKQAEVVCQYMTKGRLVLVQGRLQNRTYEAQDGSRRKATEIVANVVRFFPDGKANSQGQSRGGVADPGGANAEQPAGFDPDGNVPEDDDVPF